MLTVITGPMWSGKTSELQSIYNANLIANNTVMAFKPSNDTRYSNDSIESHDGEVIPSIVLNKNNPSYDYWCVPNRNDNDILFFEETQFFNKEKLLELINILLYHGREVICAGLPCDFEGKPFGAMGELLAMADSIIIKKAVCVRCKVIGSATKTHRKTKETAQTIVGGAEMYEPRCFKCWRQDVTSET